LHLGRQEYLMTHHTLLCAAVTVLLYQDVSAQGARNLSGTWQKDSTRSESAAEGSPASAEVPVKLVIQHTPAAVRIERHRRDGRQDAITYQFASPALPAVTPKPTGTVGTDVDQARAEWKDGRLLVTTLMHVNGMAVSTVERLTLLPSQREMHVETQLQMHHGYEGNNPESTAGSTGRDVYIKVDR
jgi:hypothetical protein